MLEKKKKHIYFPLFLFDADVSKRLDFTHFLHFFARIYPFLGWVIHCVSEHVFKDLVMIVPDWKKAGVNPLEVRGAMDWAVSLGRMTRHDIETY